MTINQKIKLLDRCVDAFAKLSHLEGLFTRLSPVADAVLFTTPDYIADAILAISLDKPYELDIHIRKDNLAKAVTMLETLNVDTHVLFNWLDTVIDELEDWVNFILSDKHEKLCDLSFELSDKIEASDACRDEFTLCSAHCDNSEVELKWECGFLRIYVNNNYIETPVYKEFPKYCEFLTRHGIHVNDMVDTLSNMLEQLLDK